MVLGVGAETNQTKPIKTAEPPVVVSGCERPGRFGRGFDVLAEDLGSRESGHALRVRRKAGGGVELPRTFRLQRRWLFTAGLMGRSAPLAMVILEDAPLT